MSTAQAGSTAKPMARSTARVHFAQAIALTVDGLGPRGGGAHTPREFVSRDALRTRAEVALAVAREALSSRKNRRPSPRVVPSSTV